jgi:CheY-like chemotaxis protein
LSLSKNRPVLIAWDDIELQSSFHKAFTEANICNPLIFVCTSHEVLEYLRTQADSNFNPTPLVILTGLSDMPCLELLKEIKQDSRLTMVPVILMSNSQNSELVQLTYALGGSSFINKPTNQDDLKCAIDSLIHYWLKVCKFP